MKTFPCTIIDENGENQLQLNEYETDPYFLQNFQSNTTVCLIIHVFCNSSANQNKNNSCS